MYGTEAPGPYLDGDNLDLHTNVKPGTKRLFSNRVSTAEADSSTSDGKVVPAVSEGEPLSRHAKVENDIEVHVGKRHRSSDWPLKTKGEACDAASFPQPALQNTQGSSHLRHRPFPQPRPSKFIEGSMNDRRSQKPHRSYIDTSSVTWEGADMIQTSDDRHRIKKQSRNFTNQAQPPATLLPVGERPESVRPSAIFRFGKSLASAFNPASWKIWSKPQDDYDGQDKVLDVRREKAERIYKELRRTGQLGGFTHLKNVEEQGKGASHTKHDSGIDMGQRSSTGVIRNFGISEPMETPTAEKRYGRVFLAASDITFHRTGGSLATESPVSSTNSSAHLGASFIPDSHVRLGDAKQRPQQEDLMGDHQSLRRLPSRKDLHKQQKLVKRVSDLEGKLEAARRQLAEALGEPIPVPSSGMNRSRFTPGALSSLPSERLLSSYTPPDDEGDRMRAHSGVGRALSTDNPTGLRLPQETSVALDVQDAPHSLREESSTPEPSARTPMKGKTVDVHTPESHKPHDNRAKEVGEDGYQQAKLNAVTPSRRSSAKRKSWGQAGSDDGGVYSLSQESSDETSSALAKEALPKRKLEHLKKAQRSKTQQQLPVEAGATKRLNDGQRTLGRRLESPKGRRVVKSRKMMSPSNTSRIPRKGRLPKSPPPASLSAAATNELDGLSLGKQALQAGDSQIAISTSSIQGCATGSSTSEHCRPCQWSTEAAFI
jgi:hypothetical protein